MDYLSLIPYVLYCQVLILIALIVLIAYPDFIKLRMKKNRSKDNANIN